MRKLILVFLILTAMVLSLCGAENAAPAPPAELISRSCVLMDAHTGEILFEKYPDYKRYPASTTKIMTLLVSIQKMDGRKMVTVPACAADISLVSTRVPVYQGEKMPLQDLWYGLIYKSGNDAANAIAYLTSGSVSAFVKDMNAKAQELGMVNTHFANAHGLHNPEHYTTARDMAILTRYALDNDLFREITLSTAYTMQATSLRDELPIDHHYPITDFTSKYYYPYAMGIKTGYTQMAGQCYVGAADKDGHELIVVLMFCGTTKNEKWTEAKRLYEYGFAVLAQRDKAASGS
ncbi:MAG: D-alanyl-D-alanine carboxypeptidase [Clostridia bacterium]|nr:D-alanyl-D-alanine carboxypeptidase [Clostridia bacterium]